MWGEGGEEEGKQRQGGGKAKSPQMEGEGHQQAQSNHVLLTHAQTHRFLCSMCIPCRPSRTNDLYSIVLPNANAGVSGAQVNAHGLAIDSRRHGLVLWCGVVAVVCVEVGKGEESSKVLCDFCGFRCPISTGRRRTLKAQSNSRGTTHRHHNYTGSVLKKHRRGGRAPCR